MDLHSFLLFAVDNVAAAASKAPGLSLQVRIPLSVLNFLEFAIWGAWWVVLGQYLDTLNFSRKQIGRVYATMPIGSIVTPLFVGWLADTSVSSEHLLAISHLLGAGLLFALALIRREKLFYWVALLYAFVYSPTLGLSNAVVFTHAAGTNEFPLIRVLGTIGWIAAGLMLKVLLKPGQPVSNRPILLASALSLVLGLFSFTLPHTPPAAAEQSASIWETTQRLFHDQSFAIFLISTLVVSSAFAFYFAFTALFLEKRIGVRADNTGPLMTLGQWVEIGGMFILSYLLPDYLGFKAILALGMVAVAIRYGIFAAGKPFALVVLAIALHGICFDFFLGAGFMYVEKNASPEIRATAQALFSVLAYGFGMYFGTEGAGWLNQRLTREVRNEQTGAVERVTDWRAFWLVPTLISAVTAVVFLLLFHEPAAAPADKQARTAAAESGALASVADAPLSN